MNGKRTRSSQGGNLMTVSAPGLGLQCASNSSNVYPQIAGGTSVSAASVSGLVAYYLSVDAFQAELRNGGNAMLSKNVITLLKKLAYTRKSHVRGNPADPNIWPPVAYNGVRATTNACAGTSGKKKRYACCVLIPNCMRGD